MRTKFFTIVTFSTLTLLTAGIIGCSKSNNNSSSGAGVSATLGGTAFNPSLAVGFFTESGQYYDLVGYSVKSNDTTALELTIFNPFTLNQAFTNDNSTLMINYYTNGAAGKDYGAGTFNPWGHATMTVTSLDTTGHKIAGTFTGTLYASSTDSLVVTNGHFNSTYIDEP